MIGSAEVNKVIRQTLSPALKQNGFQHLQTRNNWGWHGPCTWVLTVRAVGHHFSSVTEWPPMSVGVWLGVFYDFVPLDNPGTIKLSVDNKLMPQELQCQQRSHLSVGIDQHQYTQRLANSSEQMRSDIWWIDPDGSNIENAVEGIAQRFLKEGLPWFQRMTDISTTFAEIENEHNCFHKFSRAAYFAKYLNRDEEYQDYRLKMEQEAYRIGKVDWLAQYP